MQPSLDAAGFNTTGRQFHKLRLSANNTINIGGSFHLKKSFKEIMEKSLDDVPDKSATYFY